MSERKIRVLLAKMGLDCHDTAIVTIARSLRDAGMEVIYLGLHNSAAKLAAAAEQESVDVVGLSFLSGQQLYQTRKLIDELQRTGSDDVLLIVGGVIPTDHVAKLEEMGVDAVFTPGGKMSDIVDYIRANVPGGQEAMAGDRG
jgi:methylmalonyl-CoA mutase C-terminal domain/subunit